MKAGIVPASEIMAAVRATGRRTLLPEDEYDSLKRRYSDRPVGGYGIQSKLMAEIEVDRKRAGLTTQDLAAMIGTHRRILSGIRTGDRLLTPARYELLLKALKEVDSDAAA